MSSRKFDGERSSFVVPVWVTDKVISENPLHAWETVFHCLTRDEDLPRAVKDYLLRVSEGLLGLVGEKHGKTLQAKVMNQLELKTNGASYFSSLNKGVWEYQMFDKMRTLIRNGEGMSIDDAAYLIEEETGFSDSLIKSIYHKERQLDENIREQGGQITLTYRDGTTEEL